MSIEARQGKTDAMKSQYVISRVILSLFFAVILSSLSTSLLAQTQDQASEEIPDTTQEPTEVPEVITVSLPDSHQMAMALATPGLRDAALLDLAVAAHLLSRAKVEVEADHTALAQGFLDDRAWLQMLVDRYGWVRPRSAILDPAAWLVLEELQQHDLEELTLAFPGRMPKPVLIQQVFQRAGQHLSMVNLPVLLLEIEAEAVSIWNEFLHLTQTDESINTAWKVVEDAWFTDRLMPEPFAPDVKPGPDEQESISTSRAVSLLVLSAVEARPPDSRGLVQLRYAILSEAPASDTPTPESETPAPESDTPAPESTGGMTSRGGAKNTLYLINLVDGLHDGRYFEFVSGLLSITSGLLEQPVNSGEAFSLADWLVIELPVISAHFAVDFARYDPRLNTAMAAIYEVLSSIASSNADASGSHQINIKAARSSLADTVAQLALLIPDMGYYFDTPVRSRIAEEINICISIAASTDDSGSSAMTRRQFDACMDTLLQLADQETRLTELSGDINGPFTPDTLRRELSVPSWQRINYGIGYLHERFSTDCQLPASSIPNPLEWAVLATTVTWFAEHSPGFFQSPENETRLARLRAIGEQLIQDLAAQSECFAAAATGVSDPVSRSMSDYETALRELDQGIRDAESEFRTRRLSPGADVLLERDALQSTAYRPDDLMIEPCDQQAVCEMSGDLSTTRALIGLFPDEYLVAEQTGLGRIEICYRNMEWVERRSELVRADDENVANYYGRLGFNLVGRYVENDVVSDIFDFRFTSPQEHHYLFAQTSDEVLNDSCPVEWVGSRVITPLRENRGGIVPNRLTYLAASRKLPSRLLQSNWDRGAEWRDWFVTGIGVSPREVPAISPIESRLNQHLQSLYQAEQAEIYQRVLLPGARNSEGEDVSLFDEMSQVSIAKALIRMQMMLFYPDSLFSSDNIRMAVAGDSGLLEGRTLRRFREDNVTLTSVNGIARERLGQLRKSWLKQPEAVRRQGSVQASLAQALTRINSIYRQFFTSPPEPLQEIEVTAQSRE